MSSNRERRRDALGDLMDIAYDAAGLRHYDLDVLVLAGGLLSIADSLDRLTAETRRLREHLEATSGVEYVDE